MSEVSKDKGLSKFIKDRPFLTGAFGIPSLLGMWSSIIPVDVKWLAALPFAIITRWNQLLEAIGKLLGNIPFVPDVTSFQLNLFVYVSTVLLGIKYYSVGLAQKHYEAKIKKKKRPPFKAPERLVLIINFIFSIFCIVYFLRAGLTDAKVDWQFFIIVSTIIGTLFNAIMIPQYRKLLLLVTGAFISLHIIYLANTTPWHNWVETTLAIQTSP